MGENGDLLKRAVLRVRNMGITLYLLSIGLLVGKWDKLPENLSTIVVIQNSKLGDMVCTTPLFRAIKKNFTGIKVVVVGRSFNREILNSNYDANGYIEWKDDILEVARKIRNSKPDCVLVTTPSIASLASAMLSGTRCVIAPRIAGGKALTTRSYLTLIKLCTEVTYTFGAYLPGEYLKLLVPLGVNETDVTKHLAYSDETRKHIDRYLQVNNIDESIPLVAISPSVGNKVKEWPVERFAELIDAIHQRYKAVIVVLGGPADREVAKELKELTQTKYIESIGESAFTIEELKAFLDRADLFVAVDTGPIYIAEAFGTPTVNILGPVAEGEQAPSGEFHLNVVPQRDKPAVHVMNSREYDSAEALRQIKAVSVNDVLEVFGKMAKKLQIEEKLI